MLIVLIGGGFNQMHGAAGDSIQGHAVSNRECPLLLSEVSRKRVITRRELIKKPVGPSQTKSLGFEGRNREIWRIEQVFGEVNKHQFVQKVFLVPPIFEKLRIGSGLV